jgi:hypothetical protein
MSIVIKRLRNPSERPVYYSGDGVAGRLPPKRPVGPATPESVVVVAEVVVMMLGGPTLMPDTTTAIAPAGIVAAPTVKTNTPD